MFKIEVSNYKDGFLGYFKINGKTWNSPSANESKEVAKQLERNNRIPGMFYTAVDATYGTKA
jgi:hypothetical protein